MALQPKFDQFAWDRAYGYLQLRAIRLKFVHSVEIGVEILKNDSRVVAFTVVYLNEGRWNYEIKLSTYEDGVRRTKGYRTNHPTEVMQFILDGVPPEGVPFSEAPYQTDRVPFKP